MFCEYCGKDVSDNAEFCRYCGSPIYKCGEKIKSDDISKSDKSEVKSQLKNGDSDSVLIDKKYILASIVIISFCYTLFTFYGLLTGARGITVGIWISHLIIFFLAIGLYSGMKRKKPLDKKQNGSRIFFSITIILFYWLVIHPLLTIIF